ncbi:MAG: Fe-S cluster domain-containing protein [Candidatus Latescibacteria bacterium]|nr:Fe-S cluster domain-containing protein [Candidatus Latescibacterota bacterium]
MLLASIISLGILGLIFGGGLAYASRRFAVKVDPRISEVEDVLPGANCAACGCIGCSAFAEAPVLGNVSCNGCVPGGADVARKVAEILGVEAEEKIPVMAVVRCRGDRENARERFRYQGVMDCRAALLTGGGAKACAYGCLGLGSCAAACPFDAITMSELGLPVVDEQKCTGCGVCVATCPRGIMELIPRTQKVYLGCVSHDKTKAVKAVCDVGCIGCGLCSRPKITPSGAVRMEDNLPVLPSDWSDTETAVEKCPSKIFVVRDTAATGPESAPCASVSNPLGCTV